MCEMIYNVYSAVLITAADNMEHMRRCVSVCGACVVVVVMERRGGGCKL